MKNFFFFKIFLVLSCSIFGGFSIRVSTSDEQFVWESVSYRFVEYAEGATSEGFGALVKGDPIRGCSSPADSSRFAGKVVLLAQGNCGPAEKAKSFQRNLNELPVAIVVYMAGDYGVPGYNDWDGSFETRIPVVEINKEHGDKLISFLDQGREVNVSVSIDEFENQWEEMFVYGGPLLSVIGISFGVGGIFFGGYKLRALLLNGKLSRLSAAILSLEIWGNLIRILFCMDPYAYSIFPRMLTTILVTLSAPPSFTTNILIIIVWQIIVKSAIKLKSRLTLRRKQILQLALPVGVILLLYYVMDLVSSILRGAYYLSAWALYIVGVLNVLIGGCTVVFYIIYGTKILQTIKKSPRAKTPDGIRRVKLATFRIFLSGFFMITLTVGIALVPFFYFYPAGFLAILLILDLSLTGISYCQILVIPTNQSDVSSSTTDLNLESSNSQKINSQGETTHDVYPE